MPQYVANLLKFKGILKRTFKENIYTENLKMKMKGNLKRELKGNLKRKSNSGNKVEAILVGGTFI